MTPDEVGEFPKETVEEFATRTASHRFWFEGKDKEDKFVIERRPIADLDIGQAVIQAMKGCKRNPGFSTSGWIRGGPTWQRAYAPGWLKAYGC
jgi:hypothetical protein